MIKIYVLIDSRNNMPFYIGSTSRNLKSRLSEHIAMTRDYCFLNVERYKNSTSRATQRLNLITDIIRNGFEVIISMIDEVPFNKVDELELYYYNYYIKLGHELLQSPYRFVYQQGKVKTRYIPELDLRLIKI